MQRVALRLETCRLETLDHWRRLGASACIRGVDEERSFGRGTGDEAEFLGRQGNAGHQLNRVARSRAARAMSATSVWYPPMSRTPMSAA